MPIKETYCLFYIGSREDHFCIAGGGLNIHVYIYIYLFTSTTCRVSPIWLDFFWDGVKPPTSWVRQLYAVLLFLWSRQGEWVKWPSFVGKADEEIHTWQGAAWNSQWIDVPTHRAFTLPKTNSNSTWKWMVGILSRFILGWSIFRGELLVSGRVLL